MFTSIVLGFYALFFLSLSFTIYLYIRLVVAVKKGKDIPKWIYKLGHAVQGRIHVDYVNMVMTSMSSTQKQK